LACGACIGKEKAKSGSVVSPVGLPFGPPLPVRQLKVLASLDRDLLNPLADRALQFESDFLRGFGLFVENRLCLTTKTLLFHVVPPFTLRHNSCLPNFVLHNFMHLVLLAFLSLAERATSFGVLNHLKYS